MSAPSSAASAFSTMASTSQASSTPGSARKTPSAERSFPSASQESLSSTTSETTERWVKQLNKLALRMDQAARDQILVVGGPGEGDVSALHPTSLETTLGSEIHRYKQLAAKARRQS